MPQLPLTNLLLSAHYLGMRLLGTRSPTWILAAPEAPQNGGGFVKVAPAPTLPGSNLPAILINGLRTSRSPPRGSASSSAPRPGGSAASAATTAASRSANA
jgi:hypothetical protein